MKYKCNVLKYITVYLLHILDRIPEYFIFQVGKFLPEQSHPVIHDVVYCTVCLGLLTMHVQGFEYCLGLGWGVGGGGGGGVKCCVTILFCFLCI